MNSLLTSNPYSKNDCKTKHHDFQILKAHYSDKHQVDFKYPFVCKDCNMHFILEEALFHHQKTEHEIKIDTFICNDCNTEFFSISAKAYHDNLHHDKIVSELFNCKFCSHSTMSSSDLFNHHQENHPLKLWQIFQCESCKYHTKEKQEILGHMKNQHNIDEYKPYKCNQCNYNSSVFAILRRHIERHDSEEKFVCSDCGAKIKTAETLKYHTLRFHTEKEKGYICDICGFETAEKMNLVRHRKIHEEKKFKCQFCDSSTRRRDTFERHIGLDFVFQVFSQSSQIFHQ